MIRNIMPEITASDNTKKAVAFLKSLLGNRIINIVAIDPHNGSVTGLTHHVGSNPIRDFIEQHNGKRNLYYSVNSPLASAPDNKLKKEHIVEINAVWIDADPDKDKPFEEERERLLQFARELMAGENPPTVITDSGGGIQAFWFLDKPVPATDENRAHYEALSRGLADQYGTDYVQNIDRIMRIPYTWNIPTTNKKGRKTTLARATNINPVRYSSFAFITPSEIDESTGAAIDYSKLKIQDVKKPLDGDLLNKFEQLRARNEKVDELWTLSSDWKDGDRSERDFTLAKELKLEGFTLNEAAIVLWNYPHGKVQSVKYPAREIVRCYERSGNDFAEGLDPAHLARIEQQVNPILAARAAGQPLEQDLMNIAGCAGDTARAARFRSVPLHEMDWRASGRPIYRDFIYEKSFTVIYGRSNSGKSFFTADIAGHIALGRPWGGMEFESETAPSVLYICAEAGQSFGVRGKALMRRLGVDKLPFHVITEAPSLTDKEKKDAKAILKEIQRLKDEEGVTIGLVIVDTLAMTFQGNENSSDDMGIHIENMKYIQREADTGVIIVHHSGKDTTAGARGSTALQGATDTELEIRSEKNGEREIRQVEVKKQRTGKSGMVVPFGLAVTVLGNDDRGRPIDTCHVVLEGDMEFEAVAGTVFDKLTASHYYALEAAYLFETTPTNPDIEIIDEHTFRMKNGKVFTRREIIAVMCKDLRETRSDNKIVATDVGVFKEQMAVVSKPVNRSFTKFLEDQRSSMEQIGIFAFNDKYQLLNEVKEHMELRRNKPKVPRGQ